MRGQRLVQGRCNGEVVYGARTAAVCANGSINHHYSTEPSRWSSGEQRARDRRRETEGLRKRMENLETLFLTTLWKDILERANKTSKVLQSKDVDMLVAMYLLESLRGPLS